MKPEDPVEELALDLGKKKKKKKRFVGLDDEIGTEDAENRENQETVNQESKVGEDEGEKKADDATDDLDFTLDLGKKKKKKKKFGLAPAPGEEGADEDNDPDSETANPAGAPTGAATTGTSWADSDRDYTYDELLQHVFNIIREKNPDLIAGEKKKMVMRPPQVLRVGTKKTSFANFLEICKS